MRIVCDPSAVQEEWEALADRLGANPFLRPWWVEVWTRNQPVGRLEIITLRRDGELVGVLPLQRRRGLLQSLTHYSYTPVFGLLAEDAAAAPLADACLRAAPRRLDLAFLNAEDTAVLESAARRHGRRVIARLIEDAPHVSLEGDWQDYERGLGKALRKDLRRRRRRLEEQGEVGIELIDDVMRLPEAIEEAFRIEAAGWKGEEGTAVNAHRVSRRFYTEVAHAAARQGYLRLWFLRLDGRAIAMRLAVERDGLYYGLKTGYDPAYRSYSPGNLLLREVVQDQFAHGGRRIDFLAGREAYKREWATGSESRNRVQAFTRGPAGTLDWVAWAYGRPRAKRALAAIANARRRCQSRGVRRVNSE